MEKKLSKLVQVSSSVSSSLGGPSFVVKETSILLDENFDHSLIIFGTCESNFSPPPKYRQSTFLSNRFGFFFGIPKKVVRENIAQAEIILIHGFYLYSSLIALKFSKTSNIFLMPHGSLENYQEQKSIFRKKLFKFIFRYLLNERTCTFIVATESEKSGVNASFPDQMVQVVGLGVADLIAKPTRFRFLDSKLNLLSLSRIHEKKRIDISIQAIKILREKNVPCILRIAGDGNLHLINRLKKLVIDLNLSNDVIFLGQVEQKEKDALIANSDILLLPSENENFAIAVAESIVRGKPVIVSSNVAMSEFVKKHKSGVVLDSLDAGDLAEETLRVQQNYDFYQENCIKSAKLLSWSKVFENWLKVLKGK